MNLQIQSLAAQKGIQVKKIGRIPRFVLPDGKTMVVSPKSIEYVRSLSDVKKEDQPALENTLVLEKGMSTEDRDRAIADFAARVKAKNAEQKGDSQCEQ